VMAARTLTRRQRTIWYLHTVEGFTHAEIASRLAIGIGTSKSTLFQARARLQRELSRAAA
jgi:DNA-directed RNA polymerase specialized sigma24 family protein